MTRIVRKDGQHAASVATQPVEGERQFLPRLRNVGCIQWRPAETAQAASSAEGSDCVHSTSDEDCECDLVKLMGTLVGTHLRMSVIFSMGLAHSGCHCLFLHRGHGVSRARGKPDLPTGEISSAWLCILLKSST